MSNPRFKSPSGMDVDTNSCTNGVVELMYVWWTRESLRGPGRSKHKAHCKGALRTQNRWTVHNDRPCGAGKLIQKITNHMLH